VTGPRVPFSGIAALAVSGGRVRQPADFYPAHRNDNVQVSSSFPSSRAGGDAAQEISQ
jgi:hypothetical protein